MVVSKATQCRLEHCRVQKLQVIDVRHLVRAQGSGEATWLHTQQQLHNDQQVLEFAEGMEVGLPAGCSECTPRSIHNCNATPETMIVMPGPEVTPESTKIRGTKSVVADDPEKSPAMTIQLDEGYVEDGLDESLNPANPDYFAVEQHKDPEVMEILEYVNSGRLPSDAHRARQLVSEGSVFVAVDDILHYVDPKRGDQKRAVVPT